MQDQRVELLIHCSIALIILLGTMLLGIGEHQMRLTVLARVAVGISAYLTDYTGMFRLSQPLADLLAALVVGGTAIAAYQSERHDQIFVVSRIPE